MLLNQIIGKLNMKKLHSKLVAKFGRRLQPTPENGPSNIWVISYVRQTHTPPFGSHEQLWDPAGAEHAHHLQQTDPPNDLQASQLRTSA